jgi:DNA-binding transcriptional ArsR family regulator
MSHDDDMSAALALAPMAGKPDLDDGWIKLAHELDAALSVAGFTRVANMALCEIRSQVYGPAKRKRAIISPTEFGEAIGQHRQNVSRALKELEDAGAIDRAFGNSIGFRKNYRQWTDGKGKPRFTRKELAWIAAAPRRAVAFKAQDDAQNPSSNLITNQRPVMGVVIKSDDKQESNLITDVIKSDYTPTVYKEGENKELRPAVAPVPPEWESLCDEADRIFRPHVTSFPNVLRGLWGVNSTVIAHWGHDWPLAAWRAALPALAAAAPEKWNPRYYFGIVERMAREGVQVARRAEPAGPEYETYVPRRKRPNP